MPEPDFMESLKKLTYEIHYLRERTVREEKLSFTGIFLLTYIDMKGPASITEIADILGLTKSTITHLVDIMESRGYMIREYSVDDRRTVMVNIGEQGKKFLSYQDVISEKIQEIIDNMDPERIKGASIILDQISGILAEQRKKGDRSGKPNL